MDSLDYSTWLEIDLDAIENNLRQIKRISERPVMAILKANGYGHGIVPVGLAAEEAGVAWIGVSRLEEALVLRKVGVQTPILVLGYTSPQVIPQAVEHDITLALFDPQLIEPYGQPAAAMGRKLRVHLKIDTGMGRLGVLPAEAVPFARTAAAHPGLQIEGIFTHMARADEKVDTSYRQLETFDTVLRMLDLAGLRPPLVHAANSAAALYIPEARYDMVRSGIAVYGLHPDWPTCPLPEGFRPALTWKARLTSVKMLPPGSGVGYGHTYVTTREERIGVIPVGYADGYRRNVYNEVLVGGLRLPVIRRVCMDQTILNLDSLPGARIGDEVVLIGSQGNETIRPEDLAEQWKTNNYEVVCGLAARLPRIYVTQNQSQPAD